MKSLFDILLQLVKMRKFTVNMHDDINDNDILNFDIQNGHIISLNVNTGEIWRRLGTYDNLTDCFAKLTQNQCEELKKHIKEFIYDTWLYEDSIEALSELITPVEIAKHRMATETNEDN